MFTSLHHLIDGEWMCGAYRLTRKDGATGIDGVTAADYEKDLEANLESLLDRIKSGSYRAPPVRRHYIPKADGTKRPLGIPTFEDKVAQRAILMLLEPIYEPDFLPCSYGFRRGRSAHDALNALRKGIIEQRQRWVIDADVEKYFDSIRHSHLRSFLDLRIKDGVVRRMIDKWLKAGVLEEGALHKPVAGTPQGGVISPTLSNIYLHHVLDEWFENVAKPRLNGQCQLVRFADDFVIALEDRHSGKWLLDALGKRLGRYGLNWKSVDHCSSTFVDACCMGRDEDPWDRDRSLPIPARYTERGEPPIVTLTGPRPPGGVEVTGGTVRVRFVDPAATVTTEVSDPPPPPGNKPVVIVRRRPDGAPDIEVAGGKAIVRVEGWKGIDHAQA